ncbi:DUF2231 domain-containing protein [Corynebacterium heidelbergense]|uniref:DUF2231 domain-containing protein n=1 Tax=Corynebacterium heidelbergense TaxID=2055947 RepID=A0A364VB08_9CORY|nr:DUF2231 domain-containing protein [Corynebacterium heidelbergense]RAV33835.1 hypothetical protein CWC39_06470 [Corynebacterium heidelbergense]WCZ37507.1 hypothetical protein CHEID_09915 [Corynebacterium heidelbergense]
MFDFIFGVPAHPLYVHLAVVALPVAAALAAAVAVSNRLRRRLGAPAVALSAVALVGTQLAKSSGEALLRLAGASEHHPGKAATHAMLGEYSVYSALALFIALTVTVLLAARSSTPAALALAARVGTVGIAITSVVLVVWAGHAGAHLTWERMPNLAG